MVRKRSCPAVSQICSLIVLPSSSIVRIFYGDDENRACGAKLVSMMAFEIFIGIKNHLTAVVRNDNGTISSYRLTSSIQGTDIPYKNC